MVGDTSPGKNWAGNYAYRAKKLHRPASIEQLQETIWREHDRRRIADSVRSRTPYRTNTRVKT